ncbi:MAG: DUF1822 family protein [Rivularia sp. (in: cyanobacteria)]
MVDNFDTEKMFTVKCSREDFGHLQELFGSGELNKSLGVEVIDMGITSRETSLKSVILSQWLKGIIQSNWQVIPKNNHNPDLISNLPAWNNSNKQLSYHSISCKKNYKLEPKLEPKLETSTESHFIELTVKVELTQIQGEMNISLVVNSCQNQGFLPAGLKLILSVGSYILAEVTTQSADNIIQQKIIGDIGDYFSISIVLADVIVKEEFVI